MEITLKSTGSFSSKKGDTIFTYSYTKDGKTVKILSRRNVKKCTTDMLSLLDSAENFESNIELEEKFSPFRTTTLTYWLF